MGGRFLLGLVVAAAVLSSAASPAVAADPEAARLYVTVDRSKIIDVPAAITKISLTSPNIADVHVLSPTSILLNGKTTGTTSLLLFSGKEVRYFDIVVQPPPLSEGTLPVPAAEPHEVLVQRAEKMTNQVFIRDNGQGWVELGTVRAGTTEGKK